jgi:hypothetical protein
MILQVSAALSDLATEDPKATSMFPSRRGKKKDFPWVSDSKVGLPEGHSENSQDQNPESFQARARVPSILFFDEIDSQLGQQGVGDGRLADLAGS